MDGPHMQWKGWTGALLFALAGLFLLDAPSRAQHVQAHVSVDSVSVGERFTLSLVARHPAAAPALFPDSGTASFGDLTVLAQSAPSSRAPAPDTSEAQVDSVAYTVTTFALDSARVPALPVRFTADGDTTSAATPSLTIPVRSVVPDDAEAMRGLAAPTAFPEPRWPWVVLGLAALILLGGLYYFWRERRATEDAAPLPTMDRRSSYEIATDRLDALTLPPQTASAETIKRFYVDLTHILRTYLARTLGVAAMERTSQELLTVLRGHADVPDSVLRVIQGVLEQADLVKFADATPSPETHQEMLRQTRAAIEAIEAAAHPDPPPDVADEEPSPSSAGHESA